MTRLIDADELTELLNWTFAKPPFSRKTAQKIIDMARTIDAVPVIRCKDCKFYSDDDQGANPEWHLCTRTQAYRTTDDYCSRAERKDE